MEKKKTLKGIMKLMLTTFVVMGMGLFLCNPEVKAAADTVVDVATDGSDGINITIHKGTDPSAKDVKGLQVLINGTEFKTFTPGGTAYSDGDTVPYTAADIWTDFSAGKIYTGAATITVKWSSDGSSYGEDATGTSTAKAVYKVSATPGTGVASVSLTDGTDAKLISTEVYGHTGSTFTASATTDPGKDIYDWTGSGDLGGFTFSGTTASGTIKTANVTLTPRAGVMAIKLYDGESLADDPAVFTADNSEHGFDVKVYYDSEEIPRTKLSAISWDQVSGIAKSSADDLTIRFKTSTADVTSSYKLTFTHNGSTFNKTFNFKSVAPTLVPNKIKLFNGSTEVTDFTKILFAADNTDHPYSIKLYKDDTEVTTGYDVIVWTPDDTTSTVQHTATGKTVKVKSNKKFGGKTISVKVYPTGTATPVSASTPVTVEANFTFTAVPQVAKVVATDDGTKEYTSTNPAEFDANGSEKSYTLKAYDADGTNITQYVDFKGPANGTTGDITHTFTEAGAVIKVKATKTAEATLNFYAKTTLETWPSSPTAYPVKFKATVPLSVDMIITSPTSDDGKEVDITAGKTVKFKATISGVASNDLIYTVYTDETVKKTSGITKSTSGSNIILTWSHTYSKTGEYTPWIEITRKSDSATREDACAVNVDTDQLPMSLSSPASPVIVTVGHKTLVKLVTNSDFKNYLEDYDASDIEINFYKGKTSTTAVTTYCAATNIKKVDKNTLTFCIQGKALYTDADLYVNVSIDDTLVCKEFTTKIYKAPSVISSTTAATSGTPSVKFHIPTHVGTTQSNNMTVKGYEVKVFNNGNEVKSLGTVEATPGDLVFELNSERVNKIAEGVNADSYSFTLQAVPVGQINGVGDTTAAKTYNDLSALTGEKALLSGASSAFTIYRVSVSAGEDVQVGSYSGWGFAGQSVNLTATSSKYDPSGIQWSKSGNTASALAKGTSYTHKISTSTADNKLTATLATKTPTGANGAGGAAPGTGSSDGLDDVPKTAESNAPIWLIIVLVFAAMGGAYALYLQMRPATVVDTTKTSFYNRDDDYSDDI